MLIQWRICLRMEEWELFQAPWALFHAPNRASVSWKWLSGGGLCVFILFFKFTKRVRVLELQNAYAFWCSITRARYCYLAYMSADMSGSDLQFQALWKRSAFFFLCNMSVFLKSEVASKRSLIFLHTPSTQVQFRWDILWIACSDDGLLDLSTYENVFNFVEISRVCGLSLIPSE